MAWNMCCSFDELAGDAPGLPYQPTLITPDHATGGPWSTHGAAYTQNDGASWASIWSMGGGATIQRFYVCLQGTGTPSSDVFILMYFHNSNAAAAGKCRLTWDQTGTVFNLAYYDGSAWQSTSNTTTSIAPARNRHARTVARAITRAPDATASGSVARQDA